MCLLSSLITSLLKVESVHVARKSMISPLFIGFILWLCIPDVTTVKHKVLVCSLYVTVE